MRRIKKYSIIIFALFIFWLIGLLFFIAEIDKLETADTQKADAIVVLTGGRNRINSAFKIYKNNGERQKVFISGVNSKVNIEKLLRFHKLDIKNTENIYIGYAAKNTTGNARETVEWVKKHDIESILLVTSNYHMFRAKYEIKLIDDKIKIISYPVHSKYVKQPYWQNIGSFCLISLEYTKYIITKIKYRIYKIF